LSDRWTARKSWLLPFATGHGSHSAGDERAQDNRLLEHRG
jgi:hypothetical protein